MRDYQIQDEKRDYTKPVLNVFGSVVEFTKGSLSAGSDADLTLTKNKKSDPALKEDIVAVGTHPLGFSLYLFRYKPEYRDSLGHGRQFGVMADEVNAVMPEAVSIHPDGYMQVNYQMLGVIQGEN